MAPPRRSSPVARPGLAGGLFAAVALAAAAPLAAQSGGSWDGLVETKSPRGDAVFLLPGVDFREYTKVLLEPTEIAFRRNWQRDYNRSVGLGRRMSDEEAAEIAAAARAGFGEIFADAFREAGYEVVTAPGPDVLRLRTAVVDLYIAAPEQLSAGRTRSYSAEAGEATLILEARDSSTNALLGRAVDQDMAGDLPDRRTQASNRADFERLFRGWAKLSARGLNDLKARSPVNAPARTR